jgi:hypothetical protein
MTTSAFGLLVSVVVDGRQATALPGPVVGYQPSAGETFTLHIRDCYGDVQPEAGSAMALDYLLTPEDAKLDVEFSSITLRGADPMDIATLRELTAYPSTYDRSAVYLGEFDFMLRRNLYGAFKFLSVWNEQVEESVRPPSVNNINKIFVSIEPESGVTRTALEAEIALLIRKADSSVRLSFVTPVVRPIAVAVTGWVSVVHDFSVVEKEVRQSLLDLYGLNNPLAKRGMLVVKHKEMVSVLKAKVGAFQDSGSDYDVNITPDIAGALPEHWRYLGDTGIAVTLQVSSYNLNTWGR